MSDREIVVHLKGCLAKYNVPGDNRPCTCGRPRRERLDPPCAEAPGCANGYHGRPCPYAVTPIGPDAARDARVAARRADDARRAGRALDRYMVAWEEGIGGGPHLPIMDRGEAFVEAVGDYVLSRLHHNRHYAVPPCPGRAGGPCYRSDCDRDAAGRCPRPAAHMASEYGAAGGDWRAAAAALETCQHGYWTGCPNGCTMTRDDGACGVTHPHVQHIWEDGGRPMECVGIRCECVPTIPPHVPGSVRTCERYPK